VEPRVHKDLPILYHEFLVEHSYKQSITSQCVIDHWGAHSDIEMPGTIATSGFIIVLQNVNQQVEGNFGIISSIHYQRIK